MNIKCNFKKGLLCLLFFTIPAFANNAKQEVQKVYYNWCLSIGTAKGNANKILKFYAQNAILFPTLSHKNYLNKQKMKSYFERLTSHTAITCVPKKLNTHIYHKIAINSGQYVFSYKENNETITIPARFTFIYKNFDNKWLIIKHHSSKIPDYK